MRSAISHLPHIQQLNLFRRLSSLIALQSAVISYQSFIFSCYVIHIYDECKIYGCTVWRDLCHMIIVSCFVLTPQYQSWRALHHKIGPQNKNFHVSLQRLKNCNCCALFSINLCSLPFIYFNYRSSCKREFPNAPALHKYLESRLVFFSFLSLLICGELVMCDAAQKLYRL